MIQQKNFRRLSFCFVLFSAIASILLGLGQESWYLPILVCTCALAAYFCTDRLGLLYLPKFLVYVGMIAGALLAGYEYLTQMRSNQLLWVGNLLVYVQLPLYFQRKEKRVFEQWGIFLLLELVVATLVNDNVLYGVLMLPVLAVGSAALIALAEFASYQRHNETHSESTSIFTRLLHWIGVEKVPSRGVSGLQLFASGTQSNFGPTEEFRPSRWTSSIFPFALSMLLFSIGYFYMLPRLYSESFDGEGLGWGGSRIGFSEQISLQFVGELLRNESPAFRMSMIHETTAKTYRPNQPPYIRGTVVHRYIDGPGRGFWQPSDRDNYSPKQSDLRDLINQQECDSEMIKLRDCVRVNVAERSPFGPVVCSLPPYAQIEKSPFLSGRRDWRLLDPRSSFAASNPPKRRYSFLTYAFVGGQESPVLEDQADVYEEKQPNSFNTYGNSILDFPATLELIRPEINRIFSLSEKPLEGKLTKAIFLENHLADSQQFEYTLSLTGPRDSGIDPIADFLLNKKRGHCQYFASALALMLRSQGIPTRLVVGFRPSEYNEIGGYFQVSQSHAHVWVEAYFTLDEVAQAPPEVRAGIPVQKWSKNGIWLRLDPTPPVDGSNAGGSFRSSSSQTFDAMQDFWDEMVINMDKSRQGGLFSLFGDSSQGTYAKFWIQLQTLLSRMQSSRFVGGFLSPDRWFSWRVALGFIAIAASLLVLFKAIQRLFPNLIPKRLHRKSLLRRKSYSRVEFYEKLTKLLRTLGMRRQSHQTPQEFLQLASSRLKLAQLDLDLSDLSLAFYAKRFGQYDTLDESQANSIQATLKCLEDAIGSGLKKKINSLTSS
jgi:hypothetical protein